MNTKKIISIILVMCMLAMALAQPVIAGSPGYKGGNTDNGTTIATDSSSQEVYSTTHEGSGNSGNGQGGSGGGTGGSGESHDDTNAEVDDGEEGSKGKGADNKGGVNRHSGSGSDNGKGGIGGSGKPANPGVITLIVTVLGLPANLHPVEVTLLREEIPFYAETKENLDGSYTATFLSEATGDCTIAGEAIPGYTIPTAHLSLTGDVKTVEETLEYGPATVGVEEVVLDKTALTLVNGYSEKLIATVKPLNANNQAVTWSSSNDSVAEVSENGEVTAMGTGSCDITVTTLEGSKTAKCRVTVIKITALIDPEPKDALKGELVLLPDTVMAELSNDTARAFDVSWKDVSGEVVTSFNVPVANPGTDVSYIFKGYVIGAELPATFTINVIKDAPIAVPVQGISLNINVIPLQVGDIYTLIATVIPANATNVALKWESDNNSVATVDGNGQVNAVSAGSATITVTTLDGGYKAYCMLSVIAVPEIVYIYATGENGAYVEHFTSAEEVFINVENLVEYFNVAPNTTYYVKVEQTGTDPLRGEGTVSIGPGTKEYNLLAVTSFKPTTNYSNEYFVSMSTNPKYPLNDELTLHTNFKIGTAVPTVPEANVVVTLNILGGMTKPEGIIFLLAREMDELPIDTTWQDYYLSGMINDPYAPDANLTFTDEVKMMGKADENGLVIWEKPRETLKLGGYFLLEVTPNGYVDNLNTDFDDEYLVKEIHLTRDVEIVRYVKNVYVGGGISVDMPDIAASATVSDLKSTASLVPLTTTSASALLTAASNTSATTVEQSEISLLSSKHWAKQSLLELSRRNMLPKGSIGGANDLDDAISVEEITESLISVGIDTATDSISEMLKGITNMTRQQLAVLMMLAFEFGKSEDATLGFKDSEDIDASITAYIMRANELGIINGFPDKTFKPEKVVTKAEFYTILDRCLKEKD